MIGHFGDGFSMVFPYISCIHTAYIGEDSSILGTFSCLVIGFVSADVLFFTTVNHKSTPPFGRICVCYLFPGIKRANPSKLK